MLQPGVYILNYHSISWESSVYTRGIPGYTVPVDLFRRHLQMLTEIGQLVSPDEALSALAEDVVTEPLIVLWFDDGHRGVRRWAVQELERYRVKGALSVCSRFVEREELFWRSKLSYLSHLDLMRFVRSGLRSAGFDVPLHIRAWSVTNFRPKLVGVLDRVLHSDMVPDEVIEQGCNEFMAMEDIIALKNREWLLANHTAAHYPVLDEACAAKSFAECDKFLQDLDSTGRRYWVVPFGWGHKEEVMEAITNGTDKIIVWVGDKVTRSQDLTAHRCMNRIAVGPAPVKTLRERLRKLR